MAAPAQASAAGTGTGTRVQSRILPPDEWEKLRSFPPFDQQGLPSPDFLEIAVVEVDGQVVAFWCMFTAPHLEPLWIQPEYRQHAGVARSLWTTVRQRLIAGQIPYAFSLIGDADFKENLPLAARLGFEAMPATPLFLDVATSKEW